MIKETLFYKDNYLNEFETIVIECIEENGKIKVVLKETAFYPEGGGQPSDTGFIDGIKVLHVEEKNNKIFHEVENKIEIGKKVFCKINFDERFSNMQTHTGEHIVSGIICKKFKANNVGFHMGEEFTTMDFDVNISEKELRNIEKNANNAVYENIEVNVQIYSVEDAKNLMYRSKKELKEDVRIVQIGEYDVCACCGLHVKRTGEIGIIKLLKAEKHKNGTRIYMLAGFKAVEDYTNKYDQVNKISTLLSLKLDNVYEGVVSQINEIENLKKEKSILKNQILLGEVENIKPEKNIILEKDNLEMNDMKNVCNKLKGKATGVVGTISNGKFILMSDTVNLKNIFENLKDNYNIKGGGNNNMIQGKILCNPCEIIEELKKL